MANPANAEVLLSELKANFFIVHKVLDIWLKSINGTGYLQSVFERVLQFTGVVTDVSHHTPGWLQLLPAQPPNELVGISPVVSVVSTDKLFTPCCFRVRVTKDDARVIIC